MTTVQDNPDQSRYEIHEDGTVAGFVDYRISAETISLTHTEISEEFGGRGLARTLVEGTLTDVRSRGLSVKPFCPYVRKVIAGAPETWLDLVRAEDRAQFDLPQADA